jgi:hypothetical protein
MTTSLTVETLDFAIKKFITPFKVLIHLITQNVITNISKYLGDLCKSF